MGETGHAAPARRRGLSEEVADRIREAIFDGTYAPGAQLREVELSGAMDVSRGPVREALRVLEREGLVRCAWHRNTVVTTLSPDDVAELASLRGALEALAVERVTAHATETDFAALEEAAGQMERARGPYEAVSLDVAFHDAVFAAAHHQRLADAWDAVRCQVHLCLLSRIEQDAEGYMATVPVEHRGLIEALRSRDAGRAGVLFEAHRKRSAGVAGEG